MADMMKKRSTKRQAQIQTPGYNIDWERIRDKAAEFVRKWTGEQSERGESHTFWDGFFEVFGRTRRGLAVYEYNARTGRDDKQPALSGRGLKQGRIDMLWPGVLAVEHKSASETNLTKGEAQLMEYITGLPDQKKPRWGLVCNFSGFRLIDLQKSKFWQFPLSKLPDNAEKFEFFIEHEQQEFTLQLQANRQAAALIGDVYDALTASGYKREIDRLLMRLLFCMFADSTDIWKPGLFLARVQGTREDGSDLGAELARLFGILNKKETVRQKKLPDDLKKFAYINGGLFAGQLEIAEFDKESRSALLEACRFNWSKISPDIFGALFQSARDSATRHAGGEHYTSEMNILRVIRPLFLDDLEKSLRQAGHNRAALKKLHCKIAAMQFLDPACGCGNFLIVAYRELRRLEMEIILRLHPDEKMLDIAALCKVNVNQFYGIEIDSFPAAIAETALWLMDHQMNLEASKRFGNYYTRIPLTASPQIIRGNALAMEWKELVKPGAHFYIFGNPPFVDRKNRSPKQRDDMSRVFNGAKGAGNLDYVCAWYMKAARYIRGTGIRCAFVSTDSITQSAQAQVIWETIGREEVKIHFAYRSFKWRNEGDGVAQVHVVIVGFGCGEKSGKTIYHVSDKDTLTASAAANINAYLMDAPDALVVKQRSTPLRDDTPPMAVGSNPIDKGHLLLSDKEKTDMVRAAPKSASWLRPVLGGEELVTGKKRWCLWLKDAKISDIRKIHQVAERVNNNERFRQTRGRVATQEMAKTPHLFGEDRQPNSGYLAVPQTTSGERMYIPMAFVKKSVIALIKCYTVPKADLYHFGVLTSKMHMAWVNAVGGRRGDGYSYTASLVYNTFPWPEKITAAKKQRIKECAQKVLDMRKPYSGNSSLGDIYSSMPPELERAHRALDLAVDRAYRRQPFASERNRMEYLFSEYHRLTAPVIPPPKKKRTRRRV